MEKRAEIGVFGGSGFYHMDGAEEIKVDTPYGAPSDNITLATIGGKRVAFLPRHGKKHQIPPHMINYRANLWAMKELGVTRVIGPCAAGSLQAHVRPGDFVICDQFVDRTNGRKDTFYDGPVTTHISTAEPYLPGARQIWLLRRPKCSGSQCTRRGRWLSSRGHAFPPGRRASGSEARAGK